MSGCAQRDHGPNWNLGRALGHPAQGDIASTALWYQTEPHKPFPAFPSREARKPKPKIGEVDMHLWRDAWRKSKGSGSQLWGNEKEKK